MVNARNGNGSDSLGVRGNRVPLSTRWICEAAAQFDRPRTVYDAAPVPRDGAHARRLSRLRDRSRYSPCMRGRRRGRKYAMADNGRRQGEGQMGAQDMWTIDNPRTFRNWRWAGASMRRISRPLVIAFDHSPDGRVRAGPPAASMLGRKKQRRQPAIIKNCPTAPTKHPNKTSGSPGPQDRGFAFRRLCSHNVARLGNAGGFLPQTVPGRRRMADGAKGGVDGDISCCGRRWRTSRFWVG